jgi:hypothetical protein
MKQGRGVEAQKRGDWENRFSESEDFLIPFLLLVHSGENLQDSGFHSGNYPYARHAGPAA